MAEKRPTSAALRRFERGESSRDEGRDVVRWLLLEGAEAPQESPEPSAYDDAFDRLLAGAASAATEVEDGRRWAVEIVRKLAEGLPKSLPTDLDAPAWALSQALAERSFEAGLSDPERAVALARLAVEAATRAAETSDDERFGHDLLAAARGQLGNALRVATELPEAAAALATAAAHQERGTGDPVVHARILSFQASLDGARGRFPQALELCKKAGRKLRLAGDEHGRGRTLIQEADLRVRAGDLQGSIPCLQEALKAIDATIEPRLALVACHNLAAYLDELGRGGEATERLDEARRFAQKLGHRLDLVRLGWLEGRLAEHRGDEALAERLWHEARDAFAELGVGYDAAMVAMELAGLYARRERHEELRRLVEETVPIFDSLELRGEALVALELFRDAARAETAGVELVRRTVERLGRQRAYVAPL